MTEKQKMQDFQKRLAKRYEDMGLPNHAAHILKFGVDAFGETFTGPDPAWEPVFAECVKKGIPHRKMEKPLPKGAII